MIKAYTNIRAPRTLEGGDGEDNHNLRGRGTGGEYDNNKDYR